METLAVSVIIVLVCRNILSYEIVSAPRLHDNLIVSCEDDLECEQVFSNSICTDNMCTCRPHLECFVLEMDTTVTQLEQSCKISSQCNIENAYCSKGGVCECIRGTVSSQNGRKCLNVSSGIGFPCKENRQCNTTIYGTICSNRKCSCQNDMHVYNGSCFRNVDLGFDCKLNEECSYVNFSKCIDGKCVCPRKYIASASKCLLAAKSLASTCKEDIQCTMTLGHGSECVEQFCMCKELYQYKAAINKCVKDILLGEICEKHEDCYQPGYNDHRLECVLGECNCRPPHYKQGYYCIKSSGQFLKPVKLTALSILLSYTYFFYL